MCRKFFRMRTLWSETESSRGLDRTAFGTTRSVGSLKVFLLLLIACLSTIGVAGCAMATRDYPGVNRDALWNATVGAARQPKYSEWFVAENAVFEDASDGRIEIYRELKRDYAPPGGALRRECETWALSIRVDAEDRVPIVSIDSRSKFPSQNFWKQADHFFGEIDARLAQVPDANVVIPGVTASSSEADPNGLLAPAALESSAQFSGVQVRPRAPAPSEPQTPLVSP